jgi:site-specific DNA recombinase
LSEHLVTQSVIYARLSRDQTGEGESVATQTADAQQLARARGWEVTAVYVDGSISAAYEGKRPEFLRMLAAVDAGEVDAIIGRNWDRMTRNRRDDLAFIEACEQHRVHLAFTRGADIDLSTGPGQMVADILSMMSRAEIREKGDRERRANLARAEQGKFHGSRRPFGYEPGGLLIREAEAEAIRWAYRTIMNGGSLREVARHWNKAGLLTPQKNQPWTGTVVSRTLKTPRLAGMRTYHGEVVRGPDGQPIEAEWPPILSQDEFAALGAVLADPARRTTPTFSSRLLLSGVARCADCGSPIQSGGKRKGQSRYRCAAKGGHVYRSAEPVDRLVEMLVIRRLSRPDLIDLTQRRGPQVDVAALRQQVNELHGRMDALAEAFADGAITESAFRAGTERAKARIAEVQAQMPKATPGAGVVASLLTERDVVEAWDALTLDAKRQVIDVLMEIRLVAPGTKENAVRFDEDGQQIANPETVKIIWKN